MKSIRSLALFCCLLGASSARAAAPYRVGIVPHGGVEELEQKWKPLLRWISERSGVALALDEDVKGGEDAFYAKYRSGAYDVAMVNPNAYANGAKEGEYNPFVRPAGKLQGLLAVAADGPLRSLKDLRGKTIDFPSPGSYAATILNEKDLAAAGLKPGDGFTEQFMGNHMKGFLAVAEGRAAAAAGTMKTLAELEPEVAGKLRILHTTAPCPPHPFVANKRLPEDVVKKLQDAFLALNADPDGHKLIKAVAIGKVITAKDEEYASLRK